MRSVTKPMAMTAMTKAPLSNQGLRSVQGRSGNRKSGFTSTEPSCAIAGTPAAGMTRAKS